MYGKVSEFSLKLLGENPSKALLEVVKGGALLSVVNVITVFFGLLFNFLIAKQYGAEVTGLFAIAISFMTISAMVASVGTNTSVHKLIPKHETEYSHSSAYFTRNKMLVILFLTSIFISTVAYFLSETMAKNVYDKESLVDFFELAAPFVIVMVLSKYCIQSIRALRNTYWFATFLFIEPVLKVIFLIALTMAGTHMINPLLAVNLSSLLVFLLSLLVSYKLFTKPLAFESQSPIHRESFFSIFKLSLPMFLTSLMQIVISETDTVMLGIMTESSDVGVYSIAFKLAAFTSFFLGIVNSLVAPKFSQLFHQGEFKQLEELAKNTARTMVLLTFPIVVIFILFGSYLLGVFGDEFSQGYLTFVFIVIGQLVNVMAGSVGFFLNMTGHQVNFNKIVSAGAGLNIVLNYLLIPQFGIEGAAIASMLSLTFWNISAAVYTKRKFGFHVGYFPSFGK